MSGKVDVNDLFRSEAFGFDVLDVAQPRLLPLLGRSCVIHSTQLDLRT